jgi:polyribonucleotide nucleotidyltransferase
MENSELDLMMAGTDSAILMIEVSADALVAYMLHPIPILHVMLAFANIIKSSLF